MLSSIVGDFVTWTFRMTVKAVFAATVVGVFGLGTGLMTGTVKPDDLRPENLHKTLVSFQERLTSMKDFAGELSKVDYAGVVRNMKERDRALEQLSVDANEYDDVPLERLQELAVGAQSKLHSTEMGRMLGTEGNEKVVKAGLF